MTLEIETVGAAPLDPRASEHMVPMRDGVRLATDVYLADGAGPFPAVLVRLPYDKNGRYCWMPFLATHFIARGYAFVPQDVRGKFRSEGDPLAFVGEVPDGYDTIEWITQQPWSNGDVGMWGDSYYGFTQWAAVAAGHPALKAIVPRVTIADIDGWLDGVTPLYGGHYLGQYWSDHDTHHWEPDWSHRPLAEVFDPAFEQIGSRSASFDYVLERPGGPSEFPCSRAPIRSMCSGSPPSTAWAGSTTSRRLTCWITRRSCGIPETAPFQYLHAGSTDHENYRFEQVPIAESEDHAQHDDALEQMLERYIAPALDFFDAFLTGTADPAGVPRVRWHLPHVGWQESPSWPPPGAAELRLYLADPARATVDAEGGSLVAAPGEGEHVAWLHDPEDLVPSTLVDPFSALSSTPTSAPSSRAPTC